MARAETNRVGSGVLPINTLVNTTICQIQDPGKGRYTISGVVRHTLEDGCKLIVGAALIIARIPQTAAQTVAFGPVIIDVLLDTDDIIIQLAVATGAAETASAAIYAQKLNQ
jgi:hypothetical protein